jgi:hypothetical protein
MKQTDIVRKAFVLISAAAMGCSSSSSDSAGTPGDGGMNEAEAPVLADGAAGASTASVRVAHLSPDAPAVDFCIAPHGTTAFAGPVLAGSGLDGGAAGLSYGSVTRYLSVPAAQLDVRLVAPGATSCAASLAGLPDFTSLPVLPAGAHATLAAIGDVMPPDAGPDPGLSLAAFVDDATVSSGNAALRFVHAAPSIPPVDVGLGSGASFAAVFSDVAFGKVAAMGGAIDANGYYVGSPLAQQTLSARAHGSTADAIVLTGVDVPAGAVVTAFAIGAKTGATTNPLKVLVCADEGTPTGLLTPCALEP